MKISFVDAAVIERIIITTLPTRDWLVMLIYDYIDEYDIDDTFVDKFNCISLDRAPHLVTWMKSLGLDVDYWEICDKSLSTPWSWGIEIADNCPMLTKYILKAL